MSGPIGMGNLRGGLPPYTLNGTASYASTIVGATDLARLAFRGLLLRWRAPAAASLLPKPLQPAGDEVTLLLGEVRTDSRPELPPRAAAWNEARFLIPCSEGSFAWLTYVDEEHDSAIELGLYDGFTVKGARFAHTFPFAGQPLNREMRVGGVAHSVVARFERRLVTARFRATEEVGAGELDADGLLRQVGVRFFPDWTEDGAPPLVHDLVRWELGDLRVLRAWAGDAEIDLDDSPEDEVLLLAPKETLRSYFVELELVRDPARCSVLHAYGGANGSMGGLEGSSPPFTPSGRSSLGRSMNLGEEMGEGLAQAGHSGILAFFRADPEKVASMLPPPLEPVEHTGLVGIFVNRTQSGVNLFGSRAGDVSHLRTLSPQHVNWHEAFFKIPCSIRGEKCVLFPLQYKDRDHSLALGAYDGLVTKLARFEEDYPASEPAPGSLVRMTLARFNERIMTLTLRTADEVPQEDLPKIMDYREWWNVCGIRHFPDYSTPGAPALVHDLIMWAMAEGSIARAWRGELEIEFGPSPLEELDLLAPIEVVAGYYVHYNYQAGTAVCRRLHDYVLEPL